VTEIAVDQPLGPHRGTERSVAGIDAGDPRHEPIALRQIKARIESQRHNRRRALGRAHAGDHTQNAPLRVRPQIAVALRKRVQLREFFTLHPKLKLTGTVPGVIACLEHRHHNNFSPDDFGRRGDQREEKQGSQQS